MTRKLALTMAALALATAPAWAQAPKMQRGDVIPGQYIVVLKDGRSGGGLLGALTGSVGQLADKLTGQYGGTKLFTFSKVLNGYVARLSPAQAQALARDPAVKLVEADSVVTMFAAQDGATWGIDRVDQRTLPLDHEYHHGDRDGAGVNLYVIDTGLRSTHREFQGRVGGGANFAAAGPGPGQLGPVLELLGLGSQDPNEWGDCNGHGTHVAGSASGASYGIARQATLWGVRVLGCDGSGTNAGVIAGIDWVAQNAQKPAVANLSLGGGASDALDQAIDQLIASGVTTVVAAGNDNQDACAGSPNRVPAAITVGATDRNDRRSEFSNWGRCVDLSAPGSEITSAWFQSDSETKTISGTSMASPHVAGAAAAWLGAHPDAKPADVARALVDAATEDVIGDRKGSPDRLLYVAAAPNRAERRDAPPAPAPQPQDRGILPPVKLPL